MNAASGQRMVVSSLAAGALWLLVAGVRWAFLQVPGGVAQVGTLIPDLLPAGVWLWPGAWPAAVAVLGALAVAACHALFASVAARGGAASALVGTWFATVAAGATVGLALDLADVWSSVSMFGARGLLVGEFGAAAASGALWGLVIGWMPGLIVARAASREPARPTAPLRRSWIVTAASVAVAVLIAAGVAGDDAQRVDAEAQAEAARQAQAATSFGAPPDPNAEGEPVPSSVPGDIDPAWCTPEQATPLLGGSDAATGHRVLSVQLLNFSDEPCVIEGYPDIAFGDQNSHLLDVTIERGGSFMAQDPGVRRIEVPAGGYAVAFLGWDAASTHGALVGATLYTALAAGMVRGSWPVELDIVEGSTVAVTAWQLDGGAVGSE